MKNSNILQYFTKQFQLPTKIGRRWYGLKKCNYCKLLTLKAKKAQRSLSVTEKVRKCHYEPFHLQTLHRCKQIYKLQLGPDLIECFFWAWPDAHLPRY